MKKKSPALPITPKTLGINLRLDGFHVNWRVTWYSVMIWLLAIVVGGLIIAPWYYFVLPLVIFWLTFIYFKRVDRTLRMGLWVAIVWFILVLIYDFVEIIGPYYRNALVYYSDFRHWLKYPLILLTPVIWSLILENTKFKKSPKSLGLARIKKELEIPQAIFSAKP